MFRSKQEVREWIWNAIKPYSKFPPPYGRIPNFLNAERACEKLRDLNKYRKAKVVFVAPDSPLRRAREIVLEDRKILIAVKPRMKGFLIVKRRAGTIRDMLRYGKEIDLNNLKLHVDLFVQGCVAVDRKGNRIGKGSGFGDKEYKILREKGLIDNDTIYIVIAHPIQVFDDLSHLMEEHDVKVDVILTPNEIIWTSK